MPRLTRRRFVQGTLAAGATFAIAGTKSSGKILGANETIRAGVTGINGRGSAHIQELSELKGVQITYLIDVDQRTWDRQIKSVKDKGGNTPTAVQDIRKALDDPNLDVVTVATPNHWHTLVTVWACQAGKDVYVEKPCSHNVHEGRVAVEAARKHNRIVQHGTQSRSSSSWAQVAEVIASGKLGKLQVARGLCYKDRRSIGFKPNATPPPELDFNIWLGPAPEQPYHENLVHYNWHWFWDMGNGDIGNQGVHQMDIARWGIPGATLPKSVISVGGRFGYVDQGQTANTQVTIFDYGDTQLIFEVRGLPTDKFHDQKVGNIFHLEGGMIAGNRFYPKGSDKPAPLPEVAVKRGPGNGHFGNFIEAVRSRNMADLNADILEGHYSSALCHLANISYRLGQEVPFNTRSKEFSDNPAASETFARMEEHLAKENKLKLADTKYRLGRVLKFDAPGEKFVDDSQANAMLTRNYRAPFVVPDKIA
ncbi:MAG: Gfo/Idh/MocA family oxidoreductase [Planctomycetes bacterium]|nr:Gfo/Idh/MocA family oxidoreductase [Planctomycetota bacterium]